MTYVGRTVRCVDNLADPSIATTGDLGVVVREEEIHSATYIYIQWFRFPQVECAGIRAEGSIFEFAETDDDQA